MAKVKKIEKKIIQKKVKPLESEELRNFFEDYVHGSLSPMVRHFRELEKRTEDRKAKKVVKAILGLLRKLNKKLRKADEQYADGDISASELETITYNLRRKVARHYNGVLFSKGIKGIIEEIDPELAKIEVPESEFDLKKFLRSLALTIGGGDMFLLIEDIKKNRIKEGRTTQQEWLTMIWHGFKAALQQCGARRNIRLILRLSIIFSTLVIAIFTSGGGFAAILAALATTLENSLPMMIVISSATICTKVFETKNFKNMLPEFITVSGNRVSFSGAGAALPA